MSSNNYNNNWEESATFGCKATSI